MEDTQMLEKHCPICGKDTPYHVKYEASFNLESLDFAAKKKTPHMYFRNVKCDGCSLVYSTPIISPEDIAHLYRISYFLALSQLETMADDYERLFFKYIRDVPKQREYLRWDARTATS